MWNFSIFILLIILPNINALIKTIIIGFQLLLGFVIPIKNPVNVSAVIAYNWQFQYAVPPNITFFTKYYPFVQLARKKRSLVAKENYDQRLFFYQSMENTMNK